MPFAIGDLGDGDKGLAHYKLTTETKGLEHRTIVTEHTEQPRRVRQSTLFQEAPFQIIAGPCSNGAPVIVDAEKGIRRHFGPYTRCVGSVGSARARVA